ncbi:MAG: hypothetical protein ACYCW6_25620 [Candidatus Xenobia bacterium]
MSTLALSQTKWLAYTAGAGNDFDADGGATYTVAAPGRIRHVQVRLPTGSTGELHIIPYVVGRGGARASCVEFSTRASDGDQYLAGDDVLIDLDCDFPVYQGDVVQAWYDNTDAVNPHWFAMAVTIVPSAGGAG